MQVRRMFLTVIFFAALTPGCLFRPALDLTTAENVTGAAEVSNPTSYLAYLTLPALMELAVGSGNCPTIVDASTATTTDVRVTGGCTDADGVTHSGSMQYVDDGVKTTSTYEGYKQEGPEDCDTGSVDVSLYLDGSITSEAVSAVATDYDVSLTTISYMPNDACDVMRVKVVSDYLFTATYSGADTDLDGVPDELYTYDGNGSFFMRDTLNDPKRVGSWDVELNGFQYSTIDELSDGSGGDCTEPVAGEMVLSAGKHTATLIPDASTNCTDAVCTGWSLDGAVQSSEICGAVSGCGQTGSQQLLWLVIPLILLRRRRLAATSS